MLLLKNKKDIANQVFIAKSKGLKVGFVPTMGALHEGHLSLIAQSNKKCDLTICSIFVNPTQFNDPSDFEKYPITLENDILLLQKAKCDILFLPSVLEMYPNGTDEIEPFDVGFLAQTLEGEFRPRHFDGMAHIVAQLLYAVSADFLFMGQKDYQQAMIVSQMIKKKEIPTELVVCAIKREKDGLAMSSRNVRLNEVDRREAVVLSSCLKKLKSQLKRNPNIHPSDLIKKGEKLIAAHPTIKLEYIAWRKADDLSVLTDQTQSEATVLLIAAWLGGVRLIDNLVVNE